jgi:hypothetical protein
VFTEIRIAASGNPEPFRLPQQSGSEEGTPSQTFEGADGTARGSGDPEPAGTGLTAAMAPDQKGAVGVNGKPVGMKSRQSLYDTFPVN